MQNLEDADDLLHDEIFIGHSYTSIRERTHRNSNPQFLNYKTSIFTIKSHNLTFLEILNKFYKNFANDIAEIRVDTRINTIVKIESNKPDIFIHNEVNNEITLIEVGIRSQDRLQTIETKKLRKYDLLVNELALMYKF